jgi:hypothetical protein
MLSRVRSGNLVRDLGFLEWNECLYSYLSGCGKAAVSEWPTIRESTPEFI